MNINNIIETILTSEEKNIFLTKFDINTSYTEEQLLLSMIQEISIDTPQWNNIAGKFLMFIHQENVIKNRGYGYFNFLKVLEKNIELNIYSKDLLKYSTDEILELENYIVPERDLLFDYAGCNMLTNRYVLKYNGLKYELIQEIFMIIAMLLAQNENNKVFYAKKFYDALSLKKLSLATPLLANLRIPNGNLSSCFISAIDDNIESIFYNITSIAKISKNGGGVGINLSRIRSKGSSVNGYLNASGGVIPWIKIINDTAVAVNQQGRRAGAVTVALDIWHLDILDFLELQTENGDQRGKAYDIYPQIVISDLFMNRVLNNLNWTLFDPYEIRTKYNIELCELFSKNFEKEYLKLEQDDNIILKKSISAKELLKEIMKIQIETGMPYLFFKDTANLLNHNSHKGIIGNGNLCMESFSNFSPTKNFNENLEGNKAMTTVNLGTIHTCNLISLNLCELEETELEEYSSLAVRILDNTIDLTITPLPESNYHNSLYRTIGVGVMGLSDFIAKNYWIYENSSKEISNLFEKISLFTLKASALLAKERTQYTYFKGSSWDRGIYFGINFADHLEKTEYKNLWLEVHNLIQNFGLRNGELTAIAPNTSTSIIMGATASVNPTFSRFYIEKNQKGAVPRLVKYIMEHSWFYPEFKNVPPKTYVTNMANIGKWISQGVSMELIFDLNKNIKAKDIFDTIILAWQLKCKSIYYIRTIQKDSNISTKKEECDSCSG
ncbi:ribonucleoside-diphosphate reductase subunit alpha [Cetobacterium sp. SF1]|uniref:ribonucleoside-diphosphate reductase subunit alpha n=1 Tax=Cetobacterium sp. SF1 TaxID=3417654 RepID=UPI003CF66162